MENITIKIIQLVNEQFGLCSIYKKKKSKHHGIQFKTKQIIIVYK